ncbi:hypothetical protein HDU67_007233 [Dinochytrium kinnereticum]|nr:hypothetical protein HDU67_007233 [Dinochytrium kinnereticum]
MVNQVKEVRVKKQAFKAGTRSTSKHVITKLNKEMGDDVALGPMRPGRIGKNNSLILPTKLSKKKLKKLAQAEKVMAARLGTGESEDAMVTDEDGMEEEEAATKKNGGKKGKNAVPQEVAEPIQVKATPSGKGTTLGMPGVKV